MAMRGLDVGINTPCLGQSFDDHGHALAATHTHGFQADGACLRVRRPLINVPVMRAPVMPNG